MMEQSEKKTTIIKKIFGTIGLLCGAVLFVLLIIVVKISMPMLYYHFYKGDHLTCAVELYVDGKAHPLSTDEVKGLEMSNGIENTVSSVSTTETGGVISCIGGEYGHQPFEITVQPEGDSEPFCIPVTAVVGNNWELTKANLRIDVDTKSQKYTYSGAFQMYKTERNISGENEFGASEGIMLNGI